MQILKILIGFLALALAWSLLFRTGIIFRINTWLKDNIFNDQVVLYSRRRLALLLFVLGLVSLFSGIEKVMETSSMSTERAEKLFEDAKISLRAGQHQRVVTLCRILLKSDPKNILLREMEVNSLWAMGDRKETQKAVRILLVLDPSNRTAKKLTAKLAEKKNESTR